MNEMFRSSVVPVEDLRGAAGRLEAILNTGRPEVKYAAVVAHPHPPSGGTMHTKAVYHAAKAFSSFGIPVLRFNFRGVGLSEGVHDHGPGEIDDVRAGVDWLEAKFGLPVLFAGFSFGANVGLRACCGDSRVKGLVALGLPLRAAGREYTYEFLPECGSVPKLFLSGDHDEISPADAMREALVGIAPPARVVWIQGADHFFAGVPQSPVSKLGRMSEVLRDWIREEFQP